MPKSKCRAYSVALPYIFSLGLAIHIFYSQFALQNSFNENLIYLAYAAEIADTLRSGSQCQTQLAHVNLGFENAERSPRLEFNQANQVTFFSTIAKNIGIATGDSAHSGTFTFLPISNVEPDTKTGNLHLQAAATLTLQNQSSKWADEFYLELEFPPNGGPLTSCHGRFNRISFDHWWPKPGQFNCQSIVQSDLKDPCPPHSIVTSDDRYVNLLHCCQIKL